MYNDNNQIIILSLHLDFGLFHFFALIRNKSIESMKKKCIGHSIRYRGKCYIKLIKSSINQPYIIRFKMFTSQSASNQTKYLIMVNKLVREKRSIREKKNIVSWETTLKCDTVTE